MGQKVNPHGLRVGVIKDWDSRWFAKDDAFGDILVEDYKHSQILEEEPCMAPAFRASRSSATLPKSEFISIARSPGMVIGRGGAEIEKLRKQCEKMINEGQETRLRSHQYR